MNHAFSSCFIAIYDQILYFGGRNGFLRDCSQTKYIFLVLGKWECSSVVKNWTDDREVDGKYNG